MFVRHFAPLPALLIALLWMLAGPLRADGVTVVVSLKPLQLIAAAVTGGDQPVRLLLEPGQSHHHFQLRPSQRRLLAEADAVFWIGPRLEAFLTAPLGAVAEKTMVVALASAKDPDRQRAGGVADSHIWLDPMQAAEIAAIMAESLGHLVPARRDDWSANARRFAAAMRALNARWQQRFASVGGAVQPYLVTHDALGAFEARFGLTRTATYVETPEQQPGAGHLLALRQMFSRGEVRCVLQEPQHRAPALENILRDYPAVAVAQLDLLGSSVAVSADGYRQFFDHFADAVWSCLRTGAEGA